MTSPAAGAAPAAVAPVPPRANGLSDPRWGVMALVVALLALAAGATSVRNGFAYDDRWILAENGRVHELRALWHYFGESYWPMKNGAGLYRPLIIFGYALQWAVGGGAPWVFHLVNVLLNAAVAVAVFWMLGYLAPTRVAWLAAALFAVHPVHVEAVANVVGQAELWAALVILSATTLYLRDRRQGVLRRETGVIIVALFLFGIFTKEHVIVLPALLAAAEVLLFADAPLLQRLRRLRLLLWPMVIIAAGYLYLRIQVLGDLAGDVPHPSLMRQGMLERAFIMLNVIPEYARLMLMPVHLFADYSPRQLEVYNAPHPSQVAGLLLLVSTAGLFVLTVRRQPAVALAIAWFAILVAPVSNVLIPTGILLAERTLYLPSAGAMLALAVGLDALHARLRHHTPRTRYAVPVLCGAALVGGLARSSARNGFWHDSDTAFAQMVEEAPLNFKAHYAYGGQLFTHRKNREAELEWRLAIALMPNYHGVYMDLAHKYREAHLCEVALPLYRQAVQVEPDLPIAYVSIAACQLELAQYRAARTTARVAIADGFYKRAFRFIIERADSALVATDSLDPTIAPKWLPQRDRR